MPKVEDRSPELALLLAEQELLIPPGIVQMGERSGGGRSAHAVRLCFACPGLYLAAGGKHLVVSQGRAGRGAFRCG